MTHSAKIFLIFALIFLGTMLARAQEALIETPKLPPVIGPVVKPFHLERRIVAPANLSNSPRLESLLRGGNLYLSVPDVIALTLENNLDIAVQRYGPPLAREVLRRTEGGGFLRNIGQPISPGPVSVSLAGVSVNAVGLPESGSGVGSGGGITIQLGTTPPNLDPALIGYVNFQHTSIPQSNTFLALTDALLNNNRTIQVGYQQSFVTGTYAQLFFVSSRNHYNSPAFDVNPFTSGYLDLYLTQNLLQGFGVAVNNRNIRVQRNNMKVTDLQLKQQVITTVSAVLNLYWDLVSFNDDERIKDQALAQSEKLLEDNRQQVRLGALPPIEVTRAAAEVSANREALLIAQTNVAQQETVLKNALSRTGIASASLDEVHIVPLDHIVVPRAEELKATPELIDQALKNRPELEQARISTESLKINLAGTRNALLPALQAFAEFTNNGLSGNVNALALGNIPPEAFVGGYGNLLGQIFRRNFPNYSAGFSLNIPFRNRAAQGDYVADQLSLRQGELQLQKSINQVRVDVKNAVIGLQQARARYETAVATRELAQQALEAEQNRFKFGESTIPLVVQAQRDLAADQEAEIQAMANYTHAKITFDQAVGQTLEVNNISMAEAASGHVARQSSVPDNVAPGKQ
ncbi:MAG TPA: TolC family protein [Bryobacteraceae bacterium]|nr:TolC family protein [Bryobacteraceae bacterium]